MANDTDNFSLDLDQDDINSFNPNAGAGFHRVKYGDYRFKIMDAEQVTKEGENPHVMLKPTFQILHAYDAANASEVGTTMDARYAGSKASPKFMQDRLANLLAAIKLPPPITKSKLIGREFDATVVWNLGKPQMDQETGQMKPAAVFANVIAERPVGGPRHPSVDPRRDSMKAIRHLEETYGDAGDSTPATAAPAPWEAPATAVGSKPDVAPTTPTWRSEADAAPEVHQYRAHVQLKTQLAAQARDVLVNNGFDPEGPVDVAHLPADLAEAWGKAFPATAAKPAGLPGLPSLGSANGAAPAAGGAKKGTRAPRAGA